MKLRVLLFSLCLSWVAHARVVINEIMYHAPDDLDDLQFVELFNSSATAVDLSGWSFSHGIKLKLPAGTVIKPNGFVVVCRNESRFRQFYKTPIAAVFKSALSHKGERIDLSDSNGKLVDTVKFKDKGSWPSGPDGYSGSLERITPEGPSNDPNNWASSILTPDRAKPSGTPGLRNNSFSAEFPPAIKAVNFSPQIAKTNQVITVDAEIDEANPPREVNLLYRLAGPGFESAETNIVMQKISAAIYQAIIPAQAPDRLIRLRVQAIGAKGAARFYPGANEPKPAFSAYVQNPFEPGAIPFGWIILTSADEFKNSSQRINAGGNFFFPGPPPEDPMDEPRKNARARLEHQLDLSPLWFELTASAEADQQQVSKLKQIWLGKLVERTMFIDDLLRKAETPEELNFRPEVVRGFSQKLLGSSLAFMNGPQKNTVDKWLASLTKDGDDFSTMITSRLDLEGAWHAITLNSDLQEIKIAPLRSVFQEFATRRQAILKDVAAGVGKENAFRDQRELAETLNDQLIAKIKPVLSPEAVNELVLWQGRPREITVGLRAAPPKGGMTIEQDGPRPGPFGPGPGGPMSFRFAPFGQQPSAAPTSHKSAFIYYDPETRRTELFDFIQVTPRKGGQKIHFSKEQPFHEMTTINVIFEGDIASLVEPLAYEVYHRAGMPAPESWQLRLWQSGKPAGYHILVEQPNKAFLHRNKIRDDGNLYKLLWYEQGIEGQHEKKTHTKSGHADIVELIESLQKTSGDAQWQVIRKNFDVEEVAGYFAINTILSHWDGFFNNYFAYHDTHKGGKWTMFPWDQDQTWGVVMFGNNVFFNMPITFGMNGDRAPGGGGGFPFDMGAPWWRPPGWFSGPLLANPQFRKIFLAKTKQLLETVYTEENFIPIIDKLEERLTPEAKIRAEIFKRNPGGEVETLKANLQRCREHLRKRREFLLNQKEIKNAPKFSEVKKIIANE